MKLRLFAVALALVATWLNAADAARYECHRITNYCTKSAWMVFGYFDSKSNTYLTHGWWNIPGSKAKTYCFYRGHSLWMYWDWDKNYGFDSDLSFSLPGDWIACTCTAKQKIYYKYAGHSFYEAYAKKGAHKCKYLGLNGCKYRKLEKIDSNKYSGSVIRYCPHGRRLGDGSEESDKGLVVGDAVAYEDIPEDQLDEVIFVAEDKEIGTAGVN